MADLDRNFRIEYLWSDVEWIGSQFEISAGGKLEIHRTNDQLFDQLDLDHDVCDVDGGRCGCVRDHRCANLQRTCDGLVVCVDECDRSDDNWLISGTQSCSI